MELLYIWIEDYKNIHRQGFNFSPKYRFDFVPTKNDKDEVTGGDLNCTENDFPDNFFGEGISNVTAMVGENGSGKSTILKFINELFYEQKNKFTKNKYILVFSKAYYFHKINENKIVELCKNIELEYSKSSSFDIRFISTSNIQLKESSISSIATSGSEINIITSIHDQSLKWREKGYSYPGHPISSYKKFIDISSSYLLREYVKKYSHDVLFGIQLSESHIFLIEEQKKVINFICSPQIKILETNYIPKNADINFFDYDAHFIKNIKGLDIKNPHIPEHYLIDNDNIAKNFYKGDEFSDAFALKFLLNFISENSPQPFVKSDTFKIKSDTINKELEDYYVGDNQFARLINFLSHKGEQQYLKKIKNIKAFLDIGFSKKLFYILDGQVKVNLSTQGKELLYKFYNEYLGLFIYRGFLKIDFWELSSGEIAELSLYSRLYDTINKIEKRETNLLLLIDEGELGLHPQWQKEYLKNLIDVLPQIFKDKKIQIILTSHSPFLVSDLPKENIIFLRKGQKEDEELENKCIVVKEGDRKHPQVTQTFGQNIHTLFADSFFMEGGLMGEFAKEKIKNVLIDITDNQKVMKENASRKKEIEFIISQIGEPLLRKKLEKIYQQNIDTNSFKSLSELEEEEKQLKQRLEEITKQKNNKK